MPRYAKIPHEFFYKGFQVKVRGQNVYYHLYDRQNSEITTLAVSLVSKEIYLNHCMYG